MGNMSPEYQAEYRARHPEYMRTQRQRESARKEAVKRLIAKYPDVFQDMFKQELAKYGLALRGKL